MSALSITALAVLVSDQTIKLMFRHLAIGDEVVLGPIVGVRLVTTRILLARFSSQWRASVMWCLWVVAGSALIVAMALASLSPVLVGLLLGGSLSHALETSIRGGITDWAWPRFGLAFNLADLALGAGAVGLIGELLLSLCG
jgi:lipoprotein signal peptidase